MALLMDRPSGLRWGMDGVAGPSCVCPDIAASGQARPARPLAGLDTPLKNLVPSFMVRQGPRQWFLAVFYHLSPQWGSWRASGGHGPPHGPVWPL